MSKSEFARRRADVMSCMEDGIAILPTAHEQQRNGDVTFQFRPDSDFYYLTHFPEPEAVAVLTPGHPEHEFILFCRPKDPLLETWNGRRCGVDNAMVEYGADVAYPIDQLDKILPPLLENQDKVYNFMGRYPTMDRRIIGWINKIRKRSRAGVKAPMELVDIGHIMHEMRLCKRQHEIKIMRQAGRVAAKGHMRAMAVTKPGMYEYQVQAEMECVFRQHGSPYNAYPSIVAGGENACILHYNENNCVLNDGELLLIDAGAEIDCMASDITRTFPVNGKFSGPQRALYEVVLAAQKKSIEAVKSDNLLVDYHDVAVAVLTEGLVDLGLLAGEVNELIETNAYARFYMHRTGHWIGMDVHDVGDYKVDDQWRQLEPGMALTVEPGLYITTDQDIDAKWHNIGIRIEDDILVTASGNENLTSSVIKEVDDIEHLMANG